MTAVAAGTGLDTSPGIATAASFSTLAEACTLKDKSWRGYAVGFASDALACTYGLMQAFEATAHHATPGARLTALFATSAAAPGTLRPS